LSDFLFGVFRGLWAEIAGISREVWIGQAQDFFGRSAEPDGDARGGRLSGVVGRVFAGVGNAGHLADNVAAGVDDRRAAGAGGKLSGDVQEQDWS
jgi:hypothetical protein